MELPFVMVYRVTPLTYLLGRSTVKVPNFAMVNLIAGEEIVPELVQRNFRAENVIRELNKIIGEAPPREKMIRGLQRVRQLLSGGQASSLHPAERAAQAIQQLYTSRGLSQNG
jgi:lipid-A-disaccharide synthase